MSGDRDSAPSDRPALPRDAFRAKRIANAPEQVVVRPVVVTPIYDDVALTGGAKPGAAKPAPTALRPQPTKTKTPARLQAESPFAVYGERSSSRPYALRLPDAIDLALRKLAAEGRTHPLRIVDRILYAHLKAIGRLPTIREP